MKSLLIVLIGVLIGVSCRSAKPPTKARIAYQTPTLTVIKHSEHVYQHISYLTTDSFGKVPCNGMIVVNGREAIVFDTPSDDKTSTELIDFISTKLKANLKAVIPTHFHADCLGGLAAFHARNIPSYGNQKTIELAKQNGFVLPQYPFKEHLELAVGNQNVVADFWGEGHTRDNVVGYFPAENVLFGGCLIKELEVGKGFLGDANTAAWAETVRNVKRHYPGVRIVIPGHGEPGTSALLDYTIKLFN